MKRWGMCGVVASQFALAAAGCSEPRSAVNVTSEDGERVTTERAAHTDGDASVGHQTGTSGGRAASGNPFARFPSWSGDVEGPLQPMYEDLAKALGSANRQKCDGKVDERTVAIATALAPVNALAEAAWKKVVEEHPEAGLLEADVAAVLEEQGTPKLAVPSVFMWLAAQALAEATCANDPKFSPGGWALGAMRFAMSRESLYQAAFASFATSWAKSSPTNPWQGHAGAQAVVLSAIDATALGVGAAPLTGLKVTSGPGRVGFKSYALAGVIGDSGGSNSLVDSGELLALGLSMHASNPSDWAVSESILPVTIPPCMVYPAAEVVAPEVHGAMEADVAALPLLFSSRCSARDALELKVVSSASSAVTPLKLTFSPANEALVTKDPIIEADFPGSSDVGEQNEGMVPGRGIELRFVVKATPGLKMLLKSVDPALASDAKLGDSKREPFDMRGDASGEFRMPDDLDFRAVGADAFKAVLDARTSDNALGRNKERAWLRLTFEAERAGAVSAENAAIAKAAKSAKDAKAPKDAKAESKDAKPDAKEAKGESKEPAAKDATPDASASPENYTFVRYVPIKLTFKSGPAKKLGF